MLVLAVLTLVVTTLGVAVSIYAVRRSTLDSRYNISALDDGVELDRTFKSSDSHQYQTVTVEPCKGILKVGYKQTTGTTGSGMQYKMYYRKNNGGNYSLKHTLYFNKNGTWSSSYKIVDTDGYTDYNLKLLKYSGTSTKSRVLCDFMVD